MALNARTFVMATLLCLGAVSAASAADWVRVSATGADQHFYDRSKLTDKGDEITYWRRVVFAKSVKVRNGSAKSATYNETIHCKDHTLRALSWQLFNESGAPFDSSISADAEAGPILPETIGDRFQSAMCGLMEQRKKREAELNKEQATLDTKRRELESLKAEVERLEALVSKLRDEASWLMPKAVNPNETPR